MTWVGQALLRREDLPLLTGRGRFVDDVPLANPLHVAFARPTPPARKRPRESASPVGRVTAHLHLRRVAGSG